MAPPQKPGRSKQDYRTPDDFRQAVLGYLKIERFMFDFAADANNAFALNYWTVQDDSLSKTPQEWAQATAGGWGWLNPPFSRIGPWARLCRLCKAEGGQVAFLVPAAVGSNWFRAHVHGQAVVVLLNGRPHFMPDRPTWGYPKDCILVLYSQHLEPAYRVWGWKS